MTAISTTSDKKFSSTHLAATFLLSGTFMFTPLSASALLPEVEDEKVSIKVKLGEVVRVSDVTNNFTLQLASSTITVTYSDDVMVYSGSGETILFDEAVKKGADVYVFGIFNETLKTMQPQKIVVKNKSRLSRKSLSLEVQNQASLENNYVERENGMLSLWVRIWKGVTFTTAYGADRIEESLNYLQASSSVFEITKDVKINETQKELKLEASTKYKNII